MGDHLQLSESDDEENEEERLAAEMSNMSIKRTVSAKKVDYGRFNKFTSWKGIETRSVLILYPITLLHVENI